MGEGHFHRRPGRPAEPSHEVHTNGQGAVHHLGSRRQVADMEGIDQLRQGGAAVQERQDRAPVVQVKMK